MPQKTIDIQFPAAGIVRRLGVRTSANGNGPFPTPWSINVRLEDSLTNRLRGGSFTGLDSSLYEYLATEGGDPLVTEADEYLITEAEGEETGETVYLQTENGDPIVTENGEPIVLGTKYSVATGYGRIWLSGGDDAPSSGTADCYYRARLMRVADNAIFASRSGDTTDWDYSKDVEDHGRAMVLQLSEAGEIGGDVIAMVPHKDSSLLCFTETDTWILSGDPTTGTLRNVSREVGIIAARAWCKNHDTVYFLSSAGLYKVNADGSGLQALSEDRIPEELTGVDDDDCILTYYHPDRGVYIQLTASPSWFYDTAREGFWAFDTTVSDSHVILGPFRLGNANMFGRVLTLHGNIAEDSADVTWRIVTGRTAEEAAANGKAAIEAAVAGTSYASYVSAEGTWAAGRAHRSYPRTRAVWCCIWLSSEGTWAYEMSALEAMVSGKWR